MSQNLICPWPGQLKKAILKARPHRFRINASDESKRAFGVHCLNPGRGEGLMRKGSEVWISRCTNNLRSLKWTWELQRKGRGYVGTNSVSANYLIHWQLKEKMISGHRSARKIIHEHSCQKGLRLYFRVDMPNRHLHFIEVKNCHLRYSDGIAYFPDSKTMRSVKHLLALRKQVRLEHGASLFIAVQRSDIKALRPSDLHDQKFCKALRLAARAGVKVRAFAFNPSLRGFRFSGVIPVDLEPYCLKRIEKWSGANQRYSGWKHWNSTKDIS